jgi:hypothetical protein
MKTVAQVLKHDFSKGSLFLYDSNGNIIYYENSTGFWVKREYNDNGNEIYYERSDGYWEKQEFDVNGKVIYFEDSEEYWYKRDYDAKGNRIYFEDSNGYIVDKRPKSSCNGKVIEIEGKKYKLTEV